MKNDFVLTIILNEEAKRYSLSKKRAESLLRLIIAHNKNKNNIIDEKDEIIAMIRSSEIISIKQSKNQILIKLL